MRSDLTETAAVAMMPWVASISGINPWVTFSVGIASLILLTTKIIDWVEGRIERKNKRRKK